MAILLTVVRQTFRKSIHRHSQGVSNTFRALTYKAHRAVIFVIAQLSCLEIGNAKMQFCQTTDQLVSLPAWDF